MTNIECLLKRAGGTKIELGDEVYHFAPNDKGDHVCAVEHEDHIETLLSIPEGYRVYAAETISKVDLGKQQAGEHDPVVEVTEVQVTAAEPGAAVADAAPEGDNELEDLRAKYAEHFGKKPHHKMNIKSLREALGMDEE